MGVKNGIRSSLIACALIASRCNARTIAVATDSEPVILLNGIERLEGDFIAADNPSATTFGSDTLRETTGLVEFSNLGALANISLPNWESSAKLILDRVPSPTFTDFQQVGQQIDEVYVWNTTFPFFSGLTLVGAQIEVLEIKDNAYLQLVNFGAGNITKSAIITGNGGDLTLQLPNLTYAYSLEITNASEIDLPMLSSVSDGLDISHSEISELAIPMLTYVGGDLVLASNPHMDDIQLGELVNVQSNLEITTEDDEGPREISGFPYLSSVGGDLTLSGAFDNIEFPALGIVRNNIDITSTGSSNCSEVPSSLAKGTYSCNSDSADPEESTSSSKSGLATGAKAGIAVAVIVFVALLGVIAFLLWKRRRRTQIISVSPEPRSHGDAKAAPHEGSRELWDANSDHKNGYEMEYYSVHTQGDQSSQKDLINKNEMGRPLSQGRPGPEGRHEMFNTKDPPAAYELEAQQVDKEVRS